LCCPVLYYFCSGFNTRSRCWIVRSLIQFYSIAESGYSTRSE
jgi:hypothetical protein